MKRRKTLAWLLVAAILISLTGLMGGLPAAGAQGGDVVAAASDDLVFIHHSCGDNWLNDGLHDALLAKSYIDERNDITYGTAMTPDSGRPASLGDTPGDSTDMHHWIYWFNDYLQRVKAYGAATGYNKIIMFKSCYPNSDIEDDGSEPGNPFDGWKTLANYRAVYRHPDGPGNTYSDSGYTYKPLEDIFAENPDILFIPVTAPPLNYTSTNDANAHRARLFNNWLKTDWLNGYNAAHPGLNNVAVFDWFNALAYPDNHASHPNRLKSEYGGATGDSHPNDTANVYSSQVFATNQDNFIDAAWDAFDSQTTGGNKTASPGAADQGETVTYTIVIRGLESTVFVTDTVPSGLSYQAGSLSASAGTPDDSAAPDLYWSGILSAGDIVTITYRADVTTSGRAAITNQAQVSASGQSTETWEAVIIANGLKVYLPLIW